MNKTKFDSQDEKERMNRVLEGTFYYASVHTPNMSAVKKFQGLPTFKVSLGLDEANLAKAVALGLTIKPASESIPMSHVVISRKVREGKTYDEVKPDVVDSMQKSIPEEIRIGNGSTGAVKFGTYWFENNGGGVGTVLFKAQVRSLIPYDVSTDRSLTMDDEGFTVDSVVMEETDVDDSPIDFD